jgi:hypothetical protein
MANPAAIQGSEAHEGTGELQAVSKCTGFASIWKGIVDAEVFTLVWTQLVSTQRIIWVRYAWYAVQALHHHLYAP